MIILDGKKISEEIRNELISEIKTFRVKPKLIDIQIGNNPASDIYIRGKEKAATNIGIDFECLRYKEDVDEKTIIDKINELNNDNLVSGILLQLPIPQHLNAKNIINSISPNKDVDGLSIINQGKLFNNEECIISCTPYGIIKLLEKYNINVSGKHVVIVGRSNLVGKPLISLFLNLDATVTICHSKTSNLEYFTKQADIIIAAVGKKDLIKASMVKEKSIIIDVGINRIDGKIYGDVDFENVKEKCSYITPVPGGIGPMTITMLLYNTVKCYKELSK